MLGPCCRWRSLLSKSDCRGTLIVGRTRPECERGVDLIAYLDLD